MPAYNARKDRVPNIELVGLDAAVVLTLALLPEVALTCNDELVLDFEARVMAVSAFLVFVDIEAEDAFPAADFAKP